MSQLITAEQLVNLKGDKGYWTQERVEHTVEVANMRRPKEIEDFVAALSRMFGRIGMHGICRLCFKGHLWGREKGRGCCNYCAMLTAESCANKPMGCARYMCAHTSQIFPRTQAFLNQIACKLYDGDESIDNFFMGCFSGSVEAEALMKPSESRKRRLRWATRKLDGWSGEAA